MEEARLGRQPDPGGKAGDDQLHKNSRRCHPDAGRFRGSPGIADIHEEIGGEEDEHEPHFVDFAAVVFAGDAVSELVDHFDAEKDDPGDSQVVEREEIGTLFEKGVALTEDCKEGDEEEEGGEDDKRAREERAEKGGDAGEKAVRIDQRFPKVENLGDADFHPSGLFGAFEVFAPGYGRTAPGAEQSAHGQLAGEGGDFFDGLSAGEGAPVAGGCNKVGRDLGAVFFPVEQFSGFPVGLLKAEIGETDWVFKDRVGTPEVFLAAFHQILPEGRGDLVRNIRYLGGRWRGHGGGPMADFREW